LSREGDNDLIKGIVITMAAITATAAAPTAGVSALPLAAQLTVTRNVEYSEAGGAPLLLDAYVPSGPELHPAMLVLHGGSWSSGDKDDMAPVGELVANDGFAAFVVDYRLVPAGTYPAAVDDVRTAVRWIRKNAARYGVDPSRIGAFGVSAGGHLATMLATMGTGSTDTGARIRVALSWSGPQDLTMLPSPAVRAFVGCSIVACPERWKAASPLSHVDRTDGAVLLANSTDELVPLSQAVEMAGALRRNYVPTKLIQVPGSVHASYYAARLRPGGKTVAQQTLAFASKWLAAAASTPSPIASPEVIGSANRIPSPSPQGQHAPPADGGGLPISLVVTGVIGLVGLGGLLLRSRGRR
jgi:acetyl esterase